MNNYQIVTLVCSGAVLALTWSARAIDVPGWAKASSAQVSEAQRLRVPVAFTNSIGMKFVLIPPGTFTMGSGQPAAVVARECGIPQAQAGWFYDEHPSHPVTFTNAFYLGIYEVTQAEYRRVVSAGSKPKGARQPEEWPAEFRGANKPMIYVSWEQAEQFCDILNRLEAGTGRNYSLPTEAQWEYACRAGSTTAFSFGQTLATDQANYNGRYPYAEGRPGKNRGTPLPVGSLAANAWGLYDMHGNVSEWCLHGYDRYDSAPVVNPPGPEKENWANHRIVRGGAWRSYGGACRSACRLRNSFRASANYIGFRVSCSVSAGQPEQK